MIVPKGTSKDSLQIVAPRAICEDVLSKKKSVAKEYFYGQFAKAGC